MLVKLIINYKPVFLNRRVAQPWIRFDSSSILLADKSVFYAVLWVTNYLLLRTTVQEDHLIQEFKNSCKHTKYPIISNPGEILHELLTFRLFVTNQFIFKTFFEANFLSLDASLTNGFPPSSIHLDFINELPHGKTRRRAGVNPIREI